MIRQSIIPRFIKSLVFAGIQHASTITEIRKVRNMDVSYVFSFFFSLAYIIAYLLIDAVTFFPAICILTVTLITYTLGYILISRGKFEYAKHLLCFLIPLPISAITFFYFGKQINLHFYLLAFSFLPPMLWDLKDYKKIIFYQFIYLVIFTYFHFFFQESVYYISFPNDLRKLFNAISIYGSLGSILSILYVSIKLSEIYENELIEAKVKAEESNNLKSHFLANMSHEIRTPLNGILGFLMILKDYELTAEERKMYIDLMSKSGERLLDTINDIILMSKIETQNVTVDLSVFNLNEILTYLHTFYKPQAELKGLEFKLINSIPAERSVILCDKVKIEGILTNLIKNAIKFTKKGYVEVDCKLCGKNLEFSVNDTGKGIPPDKLNLIFGRFVQAEMSITRSYEGSGLGLSIVKAYIEMLNGSVTVESVEGKGSTFNVVIPYNAGKQDLLKQNEAVPEHKITEAGTQYKGLRILIADDDDAGFLYLRTILKRKGAECIRSNNGEQAVTIAKEDKQLSLILMDIKLPVLDGFEATQEIRKFNQGIPIIAQTAFALESDREKAIKSGCNDYIPKPIKQDQLFSILDKQLMVVR